MWVAEGLTHRYPTKVLAELLSTCPQYCGHCTRMDLVGNSTPTVDKLKLTLKPVDRYDAHLTYLQAPTPASATWWSPAATSPTSRGSDLEAYLMRLLSIETIRDIRLATKALAGPAPALAPGRRRRRPGTRRPHRRTARRQPGHPHPRQPRQLAHPAGRQGHPDPALDVGVRDVRNQGVLMRGVNATTNDLLDLCFALQGEAGILPYYFYMCDMIPNAEHWRVPVWYAQQLQHDIMGYLPGYATPRIVCDVPFVGKRWVHMLTEYDREHGISYWTKNYRTSIETDRHRGAEQALRLLRPDRHPARVRPAVVAQADRRPGRAPGVAAPPRERPPGDPGGRSRIRVL